MKPSFNWICCDDYHVAMEALAAAPDVNDLTFSDDDPARAEQIFKRLSTRLREDRDVARLAIEKDPGSFRFCAALKDDLDFAKYAIEKGLSNIEHCSERLKDNLEFATWAIERHPLYIQHLSDRLKDDVEFARFAVGTSPSHLKQCSYRLKGDPFLNALSELGNAARNSHTVLPSLFASDELRNAYAIATITCGFAYNHEFRMVFDRSYQEIRAQRYPDPVQLELKFEAERNVHGKEGY